MLGDIGRDCVALTFHPVDEADARAMLTWRYEAPYDPSYDLDSGAGEALVRIFTDQQNAYYSILDQDGELVAFCCFGVDTQVPGGDYGDAELDIGMGIRPDRAG